MATITEATTSLVDGVSTGTAVEAIVIDEDLVPDPVDPDNVTLVERIYVRVKVRVDRDDGGAPEFRRSPAVHLDDTIPGFSAGDAATLRQLLGKIHAAAKAAMNL
jgi:hypothetical protein